MKLSDSYPAREDESGAWPQVPYMTSSELEFSDLTSEEVDDGLRDFVRNGLGLSIGGPGAADSHIDRLNAERDSLLPDWAR